MGNEPDQGIESEKPGRLIFEHRAENAPILRPPICEINREPNRHPEDRIDDLTPLSGQQQNPRDGDGLRGSHDLGQKSRGDRNNRHDG